MKKHHEITPPQAHVMLPVTFIPQNPYRRSEPLERLT
jgi:hypothetical protein